MSNVKELKDMTDDIMTLQSKILDAIGESVIATDTNGKILYWNKSAEKLYKWKEKEVLGKNIVNITPTNSSKKEAEKIMATLIKGKTWSGEFMVKDKNGLEFPVIVTDTPLLNDKGELIGIIGVSRDISQTKKYQQQISEISEQRKEIIESISDGFFVLDKGTKVLLFNKAAEKYLGISREKVLSKKLFDAFPEARGSVFEKRYLKAIKTQKADAFEVYFGEKPYENWYDVRIYPLNGGISVFFQLITERKIAEIKIQEKTEEIETQNEEMSAQNEELRMANMNLEKIYAKVSESEKLLKKSQEIGTIGSWILDIEKDELVWSDETYRIFGLSPEDKPLDYKSFLSYVHPEDRGFVDKIYSDSVKNNTEYAITHRIVLPDGEIKHVFEKSENITDASGNVIKSIGIVDDRTELIQAQIDLIYEKDKAQGYLDIAGVILIVLDTQQKVTLVNKKGCEVLGYEENEILGKNWFDNFLPKKNIEEVKKVFNTVIRGNLEPVEYFQNLIKTKSGEERLVAWHNSIYKDKDGDIVGLLSSGEDITERKIAEDALKESEERYRRIYEKSADPILIIENDRFIDCNDATLSLLKYKKKSDITGKLPWEHSPENQFDGKSSKEKAKEMMSKAFTNGSHHFEWIHNNSYNNPIWIDVSLTLIPEKGIKRLYTIWRDITQQKKAEKLLNKNKEQLQDLFDHMNSGFAFHKIVLDKKGKPIDYIFIEINKAFEKLTGLKKKSIIGKKATEVIPGTEKDPANWIGKYGKVALTGKPISFENYSIGIKRWFSVNAYSPEKGYFATTFEDITERKEAQAELEKYRDQLQEQVKKRTAELEKKNQKLEEFNKLFIGREFRIKELRDKVADLKKQLEKYE